MREVLLIHHRLPFPLTNGMDKLRFNLLVSLAKRYKVTLAVPTFKETKQEWIEYVSQHVEELVTVSVSMKKPEIGKRWLTDLARLAKLFFLCAPFYSTDNFFEEYKTRLTELVKNKKFYFIQILSDFSACYLPYLPDDVYKITGPMDDAVELTEGSFKHAAGIKSKLGIKILYRATKRYFSKICKKSDLVLFHSPEDLSRVESSIGFDFNGNVLPVAIERIEKAEEPAEDVELNSLVFVGGFGAGFNQDAAMYLVHDILPIIREVISDVKLYLVGNNPPSFLKAFNADKNIIVTGEVPDIRPFVKKAAVYVSPVRIGTGIKTKVIEALSMSKAIVISSISLQGLWEKDDSFCIGDNKYDFADKVIALLKDSGLRKRHEKRSGALYNKAYAFSKVEKMTLECYNEFEKKI